MIEIKKIILSIGIELSALYNKLSIPSDSRKIPDKSRNGPEYIINPTKKPPLIPL